jgi:hypothetical protein
MNNQTLNDFLKYAATAGLVIAAMLVMTAIVTAQQQTFRDASGRSIGTATSSGNQTTFRDANGRTTGTAATDSSGTTVFRDARAAALPAAPAPRGNDGP